MADNQIEKVVVAGDASADPVPLATTDAPGIASFSPDDFLVDANGRVEALTKWGIAHVLTYKGVNDIARMYTISLSFGKQMPKVGDVGLVLNDDVNPSVNTLGNQLGTIVRLTAIQADGVTPIVWYGEVLGSIVGPQGIQGITGETGAIQGVVEKKQDGLLNNSLYLSVRTNFNRDNKIHVNDALLIVDSVDGTEIGNVVSVTSIYNDYYVTDWSYLGNIRGAEGTKYITATPTIVDTNTITWTPTTASDKLRIGDYVISAQSNGQIARGDIFKIIQFVNGAAASIQIPTISVAQLQLGIYNLSDANVVDDYIVWNYASVSGAVPFVGALGLCIDDNDTAHFGRVYTITAVDEAHQQVMTALTGSDIRGPVQELEIGQVTTVPNDETGAAGQATASLTSVNRLLNKLNLGLPVGPQGKQGIVGPEGPMGPAGVANVQARGTYDPDATYNQNDVVFFPDEYTPFDKQGASYICTENDVTGKTPVTNPETWGLFVTQGPEGKPGPVGPDGEPGVDGVIQMVGGRTWPVGFGNIEYFAPHVQVGDTVYALIVNEKPDTAAPQFQTFADGTLVKFVVATISDDRTYVTATGMPEEIANFASVYVTITNPATATNGNLTDAQFATLQASRDNKIIFDNEIYVLNDQGHDAGYNVYTHVGHNSANKFVIKCITVNVNNKSWVLTEQDLGNNAINLGNGTTTSGTLTATEWDVIFDNPDAIIEHGDDVYRFMYSDTVQQFGTSCSRQVFACISPYSFASVNNVNNAITKIITVVDNRPTSSAGMIAWRRSAITPKNVYCHTLSFASDSGASPSMVQFYDTDSTPYTLSTLVSKLSNAITKATGYLDMYGPLGIVFGIHKSSNSFVVDYFTNDVGNNAFGKNTMTVNDGGLSDTVTPL